MAQSSFAPRFLSIYRHPLFSKIRDEGTACMRRRRDALPYIARNLPYGFAKSSSDKTYRAQQPRNKLIKKTCRRPVLRAWFFFTLVK